MNNPYNPGITELRAQAMADIAAAMGYPTLLRRSPLRALAYAQAGLARGQYGFLAWIARQDVPFTATGLFLETWAALVGVYRKPATPATGLHTFVGAGLVPAGSVLRRGDGLSYTTDADVVVAGTAAVAITAAEDGAASTLEDGTPLSLVSPVAGVQTVGIAAHAAPGTDLELDAPFRGRMLLRWASPPQGGAASDYVEWALAVPGVTRAWDNPLGAGAGTVVVYTMWDAAEVGHGGFPQGTNGGAAAEARIVAATGDQLVVANAIYPLRPATALVYSVAPAPLTVAFALHTLVIVPQSVRDQVATAIDGVFLALSSPLGIEIELSPFEATIAAVPGMPDFTLTAPAGPITAGVGLLPVRGPVTYA